jgi:hypothetical protein
VELEQVDRLDAEVLEALLRVLVDVVGRVDVLDAVLGLAGPLTVLRRDLRRRVQRFARVLFSVCPSSRSLCPSPYA